MAYAADGVGYALDAQTGSLARIVDSYSGELQTIGTLGVTVTDIGGFDIAGKDAFAALRVGTVTSLYAVDLATGKVVSMGEIGDGQPVTGLRNPALRAGSNAVNRKGNCSTRIFIGQVIGI